MIVGFNFTKISADRKPAAAGKINIGNNITVKDVEERELVLGKAKQKGLRFIFEFVSKYEPKVGEINLTGEVLFLDESQKVEEILKDWKKDKKLPKEIMPGIINTALNKCNIQALILSELLNLPSPLPMPKVKAEEKKNYIG